MSSFLDSTGLSHLIEKIKAAFVSKADTTPATTISIDSTPTANSTNLVTSGGVKAALPTKGSDLYFWSSEFRYRHYIPPRHFR